MAGIKAETLEPGLEVACVLPQSLNQLRLRLEDVDRGEAGRDHRRWVGGGEQEWSRPVLEDRAQCRRPGNVAAQHADRLRERADLDLDAPVEIEVVDGPAPVAAKDA